MSEIVVYTRGNGICANCRQPTVPTSNKEDRFLKNIYFLAL